MGREVHNTQYRLGVVQDDTRRTAPPWCFRKVAHTVRQHALCIPIVPLRGCFVHQALHGNVISR